MLYLAVGVFSLKPLHSLSLDGISAEQVAKTRSLGVKLDTLLFWPDQIDDIVSKMGTGIAISRECSAHVPSSVMIDAGRSHLQCCPVIWSSAAEKCLKKNLQTVQNRLSPFPCV